MTTGLFIGLAMNSIVMQSSGYTFTNSEAASLVARFTTPPTDARKALIDTLVGALKTAGVWTKLDALYLTAAHDAQAARQNWIADQYNLTPFSSPVFTADRGYTTDGSASYLDTGFTPSTAVAPKFAVADGHIGMWSRTTGLAGAVDIGNTSTLLTARNGSGLASHRVNWSLSGSAASADGSGDFITSRTGVADVDNFAYRNAVQILGLTGGTPTALEANPIQIGKRGGASTFSGRQYASASIGGGFTPGQVTAYYNARLTYLQAVGAV